MRGRSQKRCRFRPLVGTGRSREGRDWRPGFVGRPLLSPRFWVKVGIICEDKVLLLFAVGGMKTGREARVDSLRQPPNWPHYRVTSW